MPTATWLPLSRGHRALVTMAALVFMLAGLAIAMNLATLEARVRYVENTSPRLLASHPDEQPVLRWQPYWTAVDGRTVHVVLAQPLTPAAPPPLGLSEWPEPGQFAASSDLAPAIVDLENRWGEFIGTIPEESLPAADSRIMVYRPTFELSSEWNASGYGLTMFKGDPTKFQTGTMTAWRIPAAVTTAGLGLVLVPISAIVLMTALRRSLARHKRTLATLEAAGVPASVLHRRICAAHAPNVAAGVGLGLLTAVGLTWFDVPIPLTEYTSRAIDMRAMVPTTAAVLLGSVLLIIVLGLAATRPPRLAASRRPRPRTQSKLRWVLAAVCVIAAVIFSELSVRSLEHALESGQASASALWLLCGGLIALITLPALMGVLLDFLGAAMRILANRRGSATGLLISRSIVQPRPASIAAAAASLVLVASVAATWSLSGQIPAIEAERAIAQIDRQFAIVHARSPQTGQAVTHLDGVEYLTVDSRFQPDGTSTIDEASVYAPAETLRERNLRPGETVVAEELPGQLGRAMTSPTTRVSIYRQGSPEWSELEGPTQRSYILFAADGGRLDIARIQHDIARLDSPLTEVGIDGKGWLVGANDFAHEMRWVTIVGTLAAVMLIGTLWLRSYDDHKERAQRLAPLETLFAPQRIVRRVHMGVAIVTSASSALVGGALSALLARSASGDLSATGGAMPIVLAMAAIAFFAGLAAAIPLAIWTRNDAWTPQWSITHG